jgi:hypothetical protein
VSSDTTRGSRGAAPVREALLQLGRLLLTRISQSTRLIELGSEPGRLLALGLERRLCFAGNRFGLELGLLCETGSCRCPLRVSMGISEPKRLGRQSSLCFLGGASTNGRLTARRGPAGRPSLLRARLEWRLDATRPMRAAGAAPHFHAQPDQRPVQRSLADAGGCRPPSRRVKESRGRA